MVTLRVDPYVFDTLMPDLVGHDRHPAAFLVYLHFWRHAAREFSTTRSLSEISEGTGLSKRAVQAAVKRLIERDLIRCQSASITAVPEYTVLTPWLHRAARES